MEKYSNWNGGVGNMKKAASALMSVFFLCLSAPLSNASVNHVGGVAFGTDYASLEQAQSISSLSNGTGTAWIGYAGTTNLTISDKVTGIIAITNAFDSFSITGSGGSITNSSFSALYVKGGTNLLIDGVDFIGIGYESGFVLPPIPGQPSQSNTYATAAAGGFIIESENVIIQDADFSGGTLEESNSSTGLTGLEIYSSSLTITGTNSFTGATATSVSSSDDATSTGGTALYAENSSVIISNGTFTGGGSGNASSTSSYAESMGGNAVNAWSNSSLEIVAGTFTGGTAGQVTADNGTALSRGGYAVVIGNNSTGTLHNGTFTGGGMAASVGLYDNSTLTVHGGNLSSGIYSEISGQGTNTLNLLGGSIGSNIGLWGSTNSYQIITISSNVTFSGTVGLIDGAALINNEEGSNLQKIEVYSGTMSLANGLTLGTSGALDLILADATLSTPGLTTSNGSEINLGQGTLDLDNGASFVEGSLLTFSIVTNHSGQISADQVFFATNATVSIDARAANFAPGQLSSVTNITTTSGITVDGGLAFEDAVNLDITLTENTNEVGRTSFLAADIANSNLLVFTFNTLKLSEYLDADGELALLCNDLDSINDPAMMQLIDNIGPNATLAGLNESYFTPFNTMQTSLQGLRAAVAQSVSRGSEFRDSLNLPKGASGPSSKENDWRFWGKYYAQFYDRSANGSNSGYDSTIHGGSFGLDKKFGQLLLGLAGGMGHYKTELDNSSEETINAAHAVLYTTWGKEHSFIDAGLAMGFNSVKSETIAPFTLNGEYDNQIICGYIGGGYGFEAEKIGTVFTPEAGIQYALYQQDAYTESSSTAVPRSFDEFDADSLQTSLGLNASMLNEKLFSSYAFKVEGRCHWLHEMNPNPGDLTFSLDGGNGTEYQLTYPMLDEDAVRIGMGLSFFNRARRDPQNIMLRLDFDELVGQNFNSHNLSAKAIFAF